MTDSNTGVASGQLATVKSVAAQNVVVALGLEPTEAKVKAVEQHIEDEMAAVQAHFALMVADIQNSYHEAISAFSYVKSNPLATAGAALVVYVLGAVFGHFV